MTCPTKDKITELEQRIANLEKWAVSIKPQLTGITEAGKENVKFGKQAVEAAEEIIEDLKKIRDLVEKTSTTFIF